MNTILKCASTLCLLLALALLVSCSHQQEQSVSAASLEIVPDSGVGPVKFGMTMDEVRKTLGTPDSVHGKALSYSSLGLAVLPKNIDGTVGAIMMGDSGGGQLAERFTGSTEQGIRMKSTRPEIVAVYGQPESGKQMSADIEVLDYRSGKIQFTLKEGQLVHITLRR